MANTLLKCMAFSMVIISCYSYRYNNWLSDDIYPDGSQLDFISDDLRELLFSELEAGSSSSSADRQRSEDESVGVQAREAEIDNDILRLGFQAMSGGAGEGKQHLRPDGSAPNVKEVKADTALPSYCSPPNPCPKGKTAADGCMMRVSDSVEFNKRYIERQMLNGLCSCDVEHMLPESCPDSSNQEDFSKEDWDDVDEYLDKLLTEGKLGENPFMDVGEKRESLSAKKGSRNKRSLESGELEHWLNSLNRKYIIDEKLRIVAKKSPQI